MRVAYMPERRICRSVNHGNGAEVAGNVKLLGRWIEDHPSRIRKRRLWTDRNPRYQGLALSIQAKHQDASQETDHEALWDGTYSNDGLCSIHIFLALRVLRQSAMSPGTSFLRRLPLHRISVCWDAYPALSRCAHS